MPTHNLKANQTPTPIAAALVSISDGSTGLVATGQIQAVSNRFNQQWSKVILLTQAGGGGYGIVKGLDLFIASGLQIGINPGILCADDLLELVASPALNPSVQTTVPAPYTVTDNAVTYLWLNGLGGWVASASITWPGTAKVYVGAVTAASGSITNIDASGVMTLSGGRFTRQTADIGVPTDTPASALTVHTNTTTGLYVWNGVAHTFQDIPPNIQTLAATLTLNPLSPTVHYLKTNGSGKTVKLPDLTLIPTGRGFAIFNYDASQSLTIQDSAGSTLTTLTAGQSIAIPSFLNSSGVLVWPSGGGAYSPGVPTAGPAGMSPSI